MKLIFVDFVICLNGNILSSYNLEIGERIDFLCITNNNEIFNSYIGTSSDKPFSKDFDFLKEDFFFVTVKKRQEIFSVKFQEEIYSGNERILATIFFDGKTYCTLEGNGKYNVIGLPDYGNNYKVESSPYGDNLFITFEKDEEKYIEVVNSSDYECVFEKKAKNIKIEDNRINVETLAHGILSRITETVYYANGEKVILDSQVHKCANVNVRNQALLGVMFLEAVIDGDFDYILSIIDEDLKQSIEDIKEYFATVFDFSITAKNDVFILTKKERNEICKFVYDKGKICDILFE